MPEHVFAFLGVVVGSLVTVAAQLIIARWHRRQDSASARKDESDALATDSATAARLFAELAAARGRILEVEKIVSEREAARIRLVERIAHLESALPAVLFSASLEHLSTEQLDVIDESSDPMVISTPMDGGQFLFVNRAFARALGRTKEEIVSTGWRKLIVEEDLDQTLKAEASAWSGPGRVVNRYLHANGSPVTFRWIFPRYTAGVALSIAKV